MLTGIGGGTGGRVTLPKTYFNIKSHLGQPRSIPHPGIGYNLIKYIVADVFPPGPSRLDHLTRHTGVDSGATCSKNASKQRKVKISWFFQHWQDRYDDMGWFGRVAPVIPSSPRIVLTAPHVYFDSGQPADVPDSSEDHEISKKSIIFWSIC